MKQFISGVENAFSSTQISCAYYSYLWLAIGRQGDIFISIERQSSYSAVYNTTF